MVSLMIQAVYDLSRGVEELELLRPWLLNIQARAPKCPVIAVGTHKDKLAQGWCISFRFMLFILLQNIVFKAMAT